MGLRIEKHGPTYSERWTWEEGIDAWEVRVYLEEIEATTPHLEEMGLGLTPPFGRWSINVRSGHRAASSWPQSDKTRVWTTNSWFRAHVGGEIPAEPLVCARAVSHGFIPPRPKHGDWIAWGRGETPDHPELAKLPVDAFDEMVAVETLIKAEG